eukprot:414350-Alexandrium_andersonii.AAC.1
MIVLSLWMLRAVIVQMLADLRSMSAKEVHPTVTPPPDPCEQARRRARPEPEQRDVACEQNESDFPKIIFATAAGDRWHTKRSCILGLVQPRPLSA